MTTVERKIIGFLIGDKGNRSRSETPETFVSDKIGDYAIAILEGGWVDDKFVDEGMHCPRGSKEDLMKLEVGTVLQYTTS